MQSSSSEEKSLNNNKKVWAEPQIVTLELGETAGLKLNFKPTEFTRSGISYNPS